MRALSWSARAAWFRHDHGDYSRLASELRAARVWGDYVINGRLHYTASTQGRLPLADAAALGGFLNLSGYVRNQVLADDVRFASLRGERLIDHGRLYQLGQLGVQLGIAGALGLMAWLSRRSLSMRREALAMMAIGLCGSLPLLISPRQYNHYLLPSLPFFALSIALLVRPRLPAWPSPAIWCLAALLVTLGSARFIWHFGSLGKDADELQSTLQIADFAHRAGSETAYYCRPLAVQQAYLLRHHGLRSRVTDHEDWVVCAADTDLPGWQARELLPDGLAIWQRTR